MKTKTGTRVAPRGSIRWPGDPCESKLIAVNYSGGRQSTILLWQVLRGEIDTSGLPVYVINADPGMEARETYRHVEMMRDECKRAGLYFETADGPNLYEDLINLPATATRMDTPAYFTKDDDGKRGMLRQKCTGKYKIAPMDRALRRIMARDFGISIKTTCIEKGFVEKWIGFSSDEVHRAKPPHQRYVRFRYPLIEQGIKKGESANWLHGRGLAVPPRSVCNACFAHSPADLRNMYANSPDDWSQAVAVDDSVRDWARIGVKYPVYVSDTLTPLRDLPGCEFLIEGDKGVRVSCDSGYCFT